MKRILLSFFVLAAFSLAVTAQSITSQSINNTVTVPFCDAGPLVILEQGETVSVQGVYSPPAGQTVTNIAIKHLVFSAGFASLEHATETNYANPASPWDLSHTLASNAPTTNDFPIHIIQAVATFSGGSTAFCNFFVTVVAAPGTASILTVDGTPLPFCDAGPIVTLAQGQTFVTTGTTNPPSGQTVTNIKIKHLVFSAGFASLVHASESSYDNPASPFDLSHTIDPAAPTSADQPIHIVQAVAAFSDGSTTFCNAFVTVEAGVAPVPTMGQWGLIIFALIMVTLSVLTLTAPKLATENGQSVSAGIDFKNLPFEKASFFKNWALVTLAAAAIFAAAVVFFGYELTNADPFGSTVASAIVAYILMLVKKYR